MRNPMKPAHVIAALLLSSCAASAAPMSAMWPIWPKPSTTASACYNISDADARAACLARAHRDPGRCYSVQRSELRAQCLAEVRQ